MARLDADVGTNLTVQHFDLVIIGAGSGNTLLTPFFDDWKVAIIERDLFGGTCTNRGCIPSKMFVHAADVADIARNGPRLGVSTRFDGADWRSIRDRIFGRIDPIAIAGERYRLSQPNVTVFKATTRFVGHKRLAVGDEIITGDHIVIAAGSRARMPIADGFDSVRFHTSDTIMRLDEVPERLIVMGGGFIASEMSHVFGSLGSRVTIVHRSPVLLRNEDDAIAMRFTEIYRRRFEVLTSTQVLSVCESEGETELEVSVDGDHRTVRGDCLLVAVGRIPNTDELAVAATGVAVDGSGFVETDAHLRTTVDGIWALGDITNPAMLKHTANAEAKVIAHNIEHPDAMKEMDRRFVPHAVFGNPQVASLGASEQALRDRGIPYLASRRNYSETAYGWAMEDIESFCKVLAHRETRQLLGAHIIGPQASTLLQQLVQGMRFGQTVDEMATEQLYAHPALNEVVEQALLGLCER
ncbi:MAG TPA: mycothione reductase [Acidimicrobiales bacterium]|nr:mycothione reductase [Acidimicrobiales bacterium]